MAESSDSSVTNKVNAQKQKTVIVPLESTKQNKTEKAVLLIEEIKDDTIPQSYAELLEEINRRNSQGTKTACDYCVLMIYIMMLEQGFVPQGLEGGEYTDMNYNWNQILNLSRRIPNDWKRSSNIYAMNFILADFPESIVRLVCKRSEDDLIVNCSLDGGSRGLYTVLIDSNQYVVVSATRHRYQNVRNFAINFKNNVSNLAKQDCFWFNGCGRSWIEDLPPELRGLIKDYARGGLTNLAISYITTVL